MDQRTYPSISVKGETATAANGNGDEKFIHDDKSLCNLVEKVVHGFVSSLQADTISLWQSFNEILEIVQPYSVLIEENAQLLHYVERSYTHYRDNPNCGLDLDALSLAFPRQISKLKANYESSTSKKVKFPTGTPDFSMTSLPYKKLEEKKDIIVPKGSVYTIEEYYDNIDYRQNPVAIHELHIKDLRKSLPFVVYEIGLREASWGKPLGITATALNTDLAEIQSQPASPENLTANIVGDSSISVCDKEKQLKEELNEEKPESKCSLTGREIVKQFIKDQFLGKSKFAYLNRAACNKLDPYKLVVVPRSKINPEHFVVSVHAILHVIPNQPSELQPLTEWYREAVLFAAIVKFNTFKYFLLAKMFRRWKRIREINHFKVLCDQVTRSLVWNVPSFNSALLRISSFIQDLEQVQFLPCDLSTQSLQKFHDTSIELLIGAQECLKLFFEYCWSVINKTRDNCFEYLEYCKMQLQKKSQDTKESLSLAKKRKAIKKQNLKHASNEVFLLDKFIKLIDQIVAAKLLAIARQNIGTFVDNVLASEQTKSKGLFLATLEFNESDNLIISPSDNILKQFLFFGIKSVLNILCHCTDFFKTEFVVSNEIFEKKQVTPDTPRSLSSPFIESPSLTSRSDSFGHPPDSNKAAFVIENSDDGFEEKADTTMFTMKPNLNIQHLKDLLAETLEESVGKGEQDGDQSEKACISPSGRLIVEGKELTTPKSLANSLAKSKLEETILKDEKILAYINKQEDIINTALKEVDSYCRNHEWIVKINYFIRTWNADVLASWRDKPPVEIQKQLTQIKAWIKELSPVAKSFSTQNGLLFVDCVFLNNIIAKLDRIFKELSHMVANHLLVMSKDFTNQVSELAQKLSDHSRDPKLFACFMAVQAAIKAEVPSLQVKVEYIKSLFEMIRVSYRQLTRTEEEAEQQTWASWENFLLCLQESSDFLVIETEQVLGELEETIMISEHQARVMGKKAISSQYLIPDNNPTEILAQLRQLRHSFYSLLAQLDDLAWCREVISGRKYDKSELLELLRKVDVQLKLWKYYDVSSHTIKEWLQMPFRKMNIKRVTEKITEWQTAAKGLEDKLLDGDGVYDAWLQLIDSFMKDFHFIQQLSDDALKSRHWRALFVSMNQQYDADYQFTIADLYGFKLGLYEDIIRTLCNRAHHEYALEIKLRSLSKTWMEKDFTLTRHFSLDEETDNSCRQMSRSRHNYTKSSDMYVLTGDDELKCLIEDNRVTLQLMLMSPYVADLKPTVEMWMRNLEQLEEILGLWVTCQRKWLYLSSVLNEDNGTFTSKTALKKFEDVDFKFKEFTNSVVRYPKVLSVLSKKRGEKGYRELQGEALASMLFSLLQDQEELLKSVGSNIEKVRETFPRLYFLSDSEVLDISVISRDPRKLIPVVRKCFPGINSVMFAFPSDEAAKLDSVLDTALNAHLLQAIAVEGEFGEVMSLTEPINCLDSQTWLSTLEKSIKISLMVNFTKCMLYWLSRGRYKTTAVSDILDKNEHGDKVTEKSLLLKYPSQCLRITEAAKWTQDVYYALTANNKTELKALSFFANQRVKEYSQILSNKQYIHLASTDRIRPTLESLLICSLHQRDVVQKLLTSEVGCAHCFEWQSSFQHHVSLKKFYGTSYCSGLPGTSSALFLQDQMPLEINYETEHYNIQHLGSEFPYGFEFLSEKASLVVRPLTERCFLALTMALKRYSCGVPYGYNETGKTEIINELAKMMGRHLVFFKCSNFTATAIVARLLTGIVVSGSWICFDEAQNLPQRLLHVLGEYLRCIKESYNCLTMNNDQFSTKYLSTTTTDKKSGYLRKCHSVTTLKSFPLNKTSYEEPKESPYSCTIKKSTKVSRSSSIAECKNIDEARYYPKEKPLPISIPLTPNAFMTNSNVSSIQEKDKVGFSQRLSDHDLGNIVFNGMLLKAHPMTGCFMTFTPTSDASIDVPDNLKVTLRVVAMVQPDTKRTLEVLLLCNGFTDVDSLAEKITFFTKAIHDELPPETNIIVNALKRVICVAGKKLRLEEGIADISKNDASEETEIQPSEDIEGSSSATSFLEEFEHRTMEESAVVYGLYTVLCPKLDERSKMIVYEVIDSVFTHTVLSSATQVNNKRVADAVEEQLKAESLLLNNDLVSKVVQLYQVLQTNRAVILMGKSGTGKTTIYQTLCRAINSLNSQMAPNVRAGKTSETSYDEEKYPKINLSVLFPRAMSENELFGWIDPVSKLWTDGILVKRARNAESVRSASKRLLSNTKQERKRHALYVSGEDTSEFHQWIVLDGHLDSGYMDQLDSLFDGNRSLSLANGEMLPLSETLSFLLEVDNLQNSAPSLVSRCGIVYCPDNTVGWKSVFKSWLKGAHGTWNISIRALGILSSLVEHCVEKTLAFLSNHCKSIVYGDYYDNQQLKTVARGMCEVQRLLAILSSLFDKYILRENDESFNILDTIKGQRFSISRGSSDSGRSSSTLANDKNTMTSSFVYAFIWAFGGDLHESCIEVFDEFLKDLFTSGPQPIQKLPPVPVFDYHLDFLSGCLLSSTEKLSGATRTIASSYVVVPRAEVYFSLLDILISSNTPVFIVGPPGSGKTSFMQNLISPRFKYTRISFANGMTTQLLQEAIEQKLKNAKRRLPVAESSAHYLTHASRSTFFFDDLNSAASDGTISNNQPLLEMLRSLISLGGLYDRKRYCLNPVCETPIIAAGVSSGCPGVGGGVTNFPVSPRLARIMVVLSFFPVSGATLRSIYCNLFQAWLEDFPAYSLTHHHQVAKAISNSTVSLFEMITEEFRPTPVHPHYIFTRHDVARVLQGMMLFSSRTKSRPRPKVRHGRRVVKAVTQSSSYGDVQHEEKENLHQDKSWPVVKCKDTLVKINSKTPAVLAPLIRVILRLWCHECTRVFSDRLIGEDKLWFSSALHRTAILQFCETSISSDDQDQDHDHLTSGEPQIPTEESSVDSTLGEVEGILNNDETNKVEDQNKELSPSDNHISQEASNVDSVSDLTIQSDELDENEGVISPHKESEILKETSPVDFPAASADFGSSDETKTPTEEMVASKTAHSRQRVVTFEDMSKKELLEVYRGPLILTDQLIEPGEDLSRIIFCRHFMSATHEPDQDKGYNEYSVAALADGLKRYQHFYNAQDVKPLDLVFFEQAVRHVARLSRCLSLASGHTLLLSKSGHGRKSFVYLASFAANCKLIKLGNKKSSRERMRSAIYLTGLLGKPVVLYVPESIDLKTMHDVSSLMNEGNCPGLFTSDELSLICAELIPGGQKERRIENMVIAQERFFRRVRSNLHIALCLEYEASSKITRSVFAQFPFLLTRTCNVDVYQPWYPSVLSKVSSLRLASINIQPDKVQKIVDNHHIAVASLMSYIHTSASQMVTQQFGCNQFEYYSPATIVELVDMFAKCCCRLWKEEQAKIDNCNKALAKIDEANDQIDEMQKDLDSFFPVLRSAEEEVKNCLQFVESLQGEYTEGREKCKQQETEIEKMMGPIEELERLAKIELDRVSPVFKSAYEALQALNVYDVEEIRSYRTPPDQVVLVVNAVCLLFGKEECWEEGKLLFSREDFIKDLEFFNMKAISENTFCRLKNYVDNPKFVPELVKEGSLAAMSICVWIRAVYNFCVVFREYFPKQQRVMEAKKILEEAVVFLGDLRVRCNEIKTEVETKIVEYKEKVHRAKLIEKQIQVTKQNKSRCIALVKSISIHVKCWKKTLRTSQYHMKTLTGDALLLAATLCYLGPMNQETRDKLLNDWKIACRGEKNEEESDDDDDDDDDDDEDVDTNVTVSDHYTALREETTTSLPLLDIKQVPVRKDFGLKEILSTEEELYSWNQAGLPVNQTALENALMMRFICDLASNHWPLLIDKDLQSYKWIKCLHQNISKDQDNLEIRDSNTLLETPEEELLPLPVSPATNFDSGDDQSTNFDESDSTSLYSNQSGRRTSAAVTGPLIRDDLKRELDIEISPVDYSSSDSSSSDTFFNDDHIIVISAVDKQRDAKICSAVTSGATVILIDIERRKIGSRLDNLLARNTFIAKNGQQRIKIGKCIIDYHPSFCLYLYTNMPPEIATDAASLPFKKCLALNMAVSSDGLQEHLHNILLSVEQPDYEPQCRSLETNIYHHQQQIKNAENALFHRVIYLDDKLLEDSTIAEALIECDEICEIAVQQLEESKTLFELTKEKQEDYGHVSEHGAALLTIVTKLSNLNFFYQFPLETSVKLFYEVISQRRRGKRSFCSTLARSAELITYITRSICSKIERSLFSDHYDVFTFLVAVEKLRFAGQITENEWEFFCRSPRKPSDVKQCLDKAEDVNVPSWISPEIWLDLVELEKLPSFHGLKEIMQTDDILWKEYFELPPALMAPSPNNFHALSVFQRALLWKVFKKENLHSVAKDLVLYQLGTNATSVISSLDEAYEDSNCTTPVVCFLPEKSYSSNWRKRNLKDPVDEIVALAKRNKLNSKLRFITVGGELNNATDMLRNACEHGLWAIIQNCHLVTEWSSELLDIFHQITLAGSKEQIINGRREFSSNPYTVTSCAYRQELVMHPQFRLWIITSLETDVVLPNVLFRYGIKLAWDCKSDFQSLVRQSFVTIWNKQKHSDKPFKHLQIKEVQAEPLFPYQRSLALFHGLLHQRCRYGRNAFNIPYHWHCTEILWALEAIYLLTSTVLCSCPRTSSQSLALHKTISNLYGGELLDDLDWRTLVSLSQNIFCPLDSSEGINNGNIEENSDILFDRLPITVKLNGIGLNESLSVEHYSCISNQLATNIFLTHGLVPKLNCSLRPLGYFQEILHALHGIKSSLHITSLDKTDEGETAFNVFLISETSRYLALLNNIESQLKGIIKGQKGEASFSSDLFELAVLLGDGKTPRNWHGGSKICPTLPNWIISLKHQIRALSKYMQQQKSAPRIINLAAFLSKNSLFYAVLTDWAKARGRSVHEMDISTEVLPQNCVRDQTFSDGVYLTGLVLNNAIWNENEMRLEELKVGEHLETKMPCLLLKPIDKNKDQPKSGDGTIYNCPVYLYDDLPCKREQTFFIPHVQLSSYLPCRIWQQRQVYLTSCIM